MKKTKERIKVLYILPTLDFGGIESHRYIISKYHKNDMYQIEFCSLFGKGTIFNKIKSRGYKVYSLSDKYKKINFSLFLKLNKLIKSNKYHIVHTCAAEANFYGMLSSLNSKVPVKIIEEVGITDYKLKGKFIYGYIFNNIADKVIAVSENVSQNIQKYFKIQDNKIDVIYNPFDIESYKLLDKFNCQVNEKLNLITISRLVEEKNIILLLKAIKKLIIEFPNIKLQIVGEGKKRKELEKFVIENDLDKNVIFLGFQDNVKIFLSNSEYFILPSKKEGLSISLIEAMAMKKIVVASKTGGIPEVINDKHNGFMFKNNSLDDLVKVLKEVFLLSNLKKEIIKENAYKTVITRFSPNTYLDKLYHLYERLLYEKNVIY